MGKLILQTRESEKRTVQDSFEVKTWKDVNLIHVKPTSSRGIDQFEFDELSYKLGEFPRDARPIVIVGETFDLDIYYIEPDPGPEWVQQELELK